MRLRDYFDELEKEIRQAKFLSSYNLFIDETPPNIGFIKGVVYFVGGSELHFREFIEAETDIEKIKYSYHYKHKNRLIFRYDNASDPKARRLAAYPHHKHIGDKLVASQPPELRKVLEEITSFITL